MLQFTHIPILITLLCTSFCYSQDTLRFNFNPIKTPTFFNQYRLVNGLSSPNNGRVDVFDVASKDKIGIPENYTGISNPSNLNSNYLGITTLVGDSVFTLKEKVDYGIAYTQFKEKGFIQLLLPKALEAEKEYDISFKVSLADNSRFATSGWGAYLSNTELKNIVNLCGTIKPQVNFNGIIKEKLKWTELKTRYKTKDAAKYITIGCFDGNFKTEEVLGGYGFGNSRSYYYITDVELIEIPPDIDKDGIYDFKDKCPDIAGLLKFDGCPDTDGDDIPDPLDFCPLAKGLPQFEGCPDTDGDGIEDSEDKCPTEFGKITDKGCPLIIIEPVVIDEKNIQSVVKTIQFEPGKEEFKTGSKLILDNLVNALKTAPTLTISIDNVIDEGEDLTKNRELYTKRASLIINYLTSNGCDSKNIKYIGKTNATKNDNIKNNGGRRIEVEVTNPK